MHICMGLPKLRKGSHMISYISHPIVVDDTSRLILQPTHVVSHFIPRTSSINCPYKSNIGYTHSWVYISHFNADNMRHGPKMVCFSYDWITVGLMIN